MPKPNIYLFIGEDGDSKLNKINALKKECLSKDTADFNTETLFAEDASPKILQEALSRLPVKSKKRLLVIHNIDDLSRDSMEAFVPLLVKLSSSMVLILDAQKEGARLNDIAGFAQTAYFTKAKPYDAFTLGRAIENKNSDFALLVLKDLLLRGEKPERILGGLAWKWENMQKGLGREKIDKGFAALLEADFNLKLSRVKPETALELLVVKLGLL